MIIQLKKFDPNIIKPNNTIIAIGKRGSGKSVCVKDLLWHLRNEFYGGILMSASEECNMFWSSVVPDSFIFHEYKPEAVRRLIRQQRRARRKGSVPEPMFCIAEDCLYDKKLSTDVNARALFQNGRHYMIGFILTLQYCLDIAPALRNNTDFVFVFREHVLENRRRLYESFFGIFPSFESFDATINACTEGYDCLVLDNTARTNNIESCVFWYRATPRDNFTLGSKAYWAFHFSHYVPEGDDDSEEEENNAIRRGVKGANKGKHISIKRVGDETSSK